MLSYVVRFYGNPFSMTTNLCLHCIKYNGHVVYVYTRHIACSSCLVVLMTYLMLESTLQLHQHLQIDYLRKNSYSTGKIIYLCRINSYDTGKIIYLCRQDSYSTGKIIYLCRKDRYSTGKIIYLTGIIRGDTQYAGMLNRSQSVAFYKDKLKCYTMSLNSVEYSCIISATSVTVCLTTIS